MEELLSRKVGGNFKKKACVKAHGTALRRQKQVKMHNQEQSRIILSPDFFSIGAKILHLDLTCV
jgi:hypothetical protein